MMTVEEAFEEMVRRGWGYAKLSGLTAVGPITNPRYREEGEPPVIDTYGVDMDPVRAVEKAIRTEDLKNATH